MKLQLNPALAALLSFFLPGLGQAAGGKPRRGAIVAIPALALATVFGFMLIFARHALFDGLVTPTWLVSLLLLDIVATFYHVWAVVDAYLSVEKSPIESMSARRQPRRRTPSLGAGAAVLMGVLVATVGVHMFFGITDVTAQNALSCVFRPGAPCGVANGGYFDPGTSVADQSLDPADFATANPSGSAAPAGTPVAGWVANTDGVKVRSGAGTTFAIITQIAVGTVITGQVVTGASYTSSAGTSTDWIKID